MRAEQDRLLPSWRDECLDLFPSRKTRDLHWRYLNHDQRTALVQTLAPKRFGISITASHKVTIPGSKYEATFKTPGYLYNYMVRWLLERIVGTCSRAGAKSENCISVVFSRRRGTDYASMRDYLLKLERGDDIIKSPRDTNWSLLDIDSIDVVNHSKRAGLQLADCCTSAFFSALEENRYGNTETSYALQLKERLIKENRSPSNCGLTIVPNLSSAKCNEQQNGFIRHVWES